MRAAVVPGLAMTCLGVGTARADVVAFDSTLASVNGWELIADIGAHYESSSRVEVAGGFEGDGQVGDIVTLAGAGRTVTQFQTRFFRNNPAGSGGLTFKTTLTLYTLSGGLPDQVIWSGQLTGSFPTSGFGTDKLDFNYAPNVDVPETFGYGISIDDIPDVGYSFGPRWTHAAATVGSSPNYALLQDSASLAWRQEDPVVYNLEAKVWTIPAPASVGIGFVGGALAMRRRR